jgi:NADP-dependent 3-hydroxy acid dehydrogenase YdfG
MASKFKGQVVWITGASSGIGAALAKEFVKEGAIVALSARRVERLAELAKELGNCAHVFALDVQKKAKVEEVASDIVAQFGKIDVVIANAGYGVIGMMEDLSEEVWRKLFDTNVFGVVWTLQAAIPHLKKSHGRIAIMSSVAGKLAFGQGAAYSASKFALMGIANSIYQELHNDGVSVTTIAPGLVESEIHSIDNLGKMQLSDRLDKKATLLKWPTDRAARVMVKAIHERKREEVITGHGKVAAFLGTHLPGLTYWGMAKVGAKNGFKTNFEAVDF